MENATELISRLNALFYVSLGVAILGLVLAVVIFFLFDIPTVFALRTGKRQKQAVEKLNRRSTRHGRFSSKRDLEKGTTEQLRRQNMASLRMESHTADIEEKADTPVIQAPQKPTAAETEILKAGETQLLGAEETTTLTRPAVSGTVEAYQPMESGITQDLTGVKPPMQGSYHFVLVKEAVYCDSQERI